MTVFIRTVISLILIASANSALAQLTGEDSQFWWRGSTGMEGELDSSSTFGRQLAVGDFDGDGRLDLALGDSEYTVLEDYSEGAVNILYNSFRGLYWPGNQIWHQDSPGIVGTPELYDSFGVAIASGDFNGDGKDDLAIGVSGEGLGSIKRAGAVHVLSGSDEGLTATLSQFLHQDVGDLLGEAELDDGFGRTLAAGDFNGDGKDDLAIGIPGESIGELSAAGAVQVLYGSVHGLSDDGNQLWHQDVEGIQGQAEAQDKFGSAVASGDFNGDGIDDLAIGVSQENYGPITSAGAVHILLGTFNGFTAEADQLWHREVAGVEGDALAYTYFGGVLATGDVNGDGKDDLAIGVSEETVGGEVFAGSVQVFLGGVLGLAVEGNKIWHQDVPGIGGQVGKEHYFGSSIAMGDFNGDGKDDLAIGAAGEDVNDKYLAGSVNIVFGSSDGLKATGSQYLHQGLDGLTGNLETFGHNFGSSLVAGNFNGNNKHDLVIGVRGFNLGGAGIGGAVHVLFDDQRLLFKNGFE